MHEKQKAGKFYNRALHESDKALMIQVMALILEVLLKILPNTCIRNINCFRVGKMKSHL